MTETPRAPLFLSVVTPIYQAQAHAVAFYERMSAAAQKLSSDYEIIFVNDGSNDDSLAVLMALHAGDPRVVVIDLSRNFGQHKAIYTGLEHARGDVVFVLDDDLEDQPEWLGEFHTVMQAQNAEVVLGVQRARAGSFSKRWAGEFFYFAMRRLFGVDIVKNIVTARLMSRRYVDVLIAHKEQGFELSIVGSYIGFKRAIVSVDKKAKLHSSYTLRKKIRFFENYVTSATTEPLHWVMPLGFACAVIGVLIGMVAAAKFMLFGTPVRTSMWLLMSLWLLGGLILGVLGGISLYIAKVVNEVRGRPQTIIRAFYKH